MVRFSFLIAATIISITLVASGTVQIAYGWQQAYIEGYETCYATSVVQTSDGGYALAGNSNAHFAMVKTDSSGNLQWSKIFNVTTSLGATDLVQAKDGGYVLAGGDFILLKTDSNGNVEWIHSYGNENEKAARAVIQTEDGGYALAGFSITRYDAGDMGTLSNLNYRLVKTDSMGKMLWNQTYDSKGNGDYAYDLLQTSDGSYVLVGSGIGLMKTDPAGNMEWNNPSYSNDPDLGPRALIQTSDGGYAMLRSDYVLFKTDAAGNMQWNKTFSGNFVRSLIEVSDGYVLCGFAREDWKSLFRLTKTDLSGNRIWEKDFNGEGFCVIQTSDGGLAAAGKSASKFCLIKMDASGTSITDDPDYSTVPAPEKPRDYSLFIILSAFVVVFALALCLGLFYGIRNYIRSLKEKEKKETLSCCAEQVHSLYERCFFLLRV